MKRMLLPIVLVFMCACSNNVKTMENEYAGKLESKYALERKSDKKILLDSLVAPKTPYMQLYEDVSGNRFLTMLSVYDHSIYFYDYDSGGFVKKIKYVKNGKDGILGIGGYYVKNLDSIYVYNHALVQLVLTDGEGHIRSKHLLRGNDETWTSHYPQYNFTTASPIMEKDNALFMCGFSPFSIKEEQINDFRFMSRFDMQDGELSFHHLYPSELYGDNANWDDPSYMQVYTTYKPSGELILGYTVSHYMNVAGSYDAETYSQVYGGSNVAGTISSIDWDSNHTITPDELIYTHYMRQDIYGPILYDSWRNVYYRFMQKRIPGASIQNKLTEKDIIIILLDKNLTYMGETCIGTGDVWNISNSFVTKEGLNVEFIDKEDTEELYMNFGIFTINEI